MNVLEEADSLINGERQKSYGSAVESHEQIADMWTAYIGGIEPLTAIDVTNMMVLLKVCRSKGSLKFAQFHRDSFVDMAGYAALGERIWDEINDSSEDCSFFIEHVAAPVVPRVWQMWNDVPRGVVVKDRDGDHWWKHDGSFSIRWSGKDDWIPETGLQHIRPSDEDAPFIEVVQ